MTFRHLALRLAAMLLATQTGCSLFRDKETASAAPEPKAVAEAKSKEESLIQQVSHKIMPPAKKDEEKGPVSNSPVKQVHAIWNGQLSTTRDTVNNGAELRGLIGRLYLFGEEVGFPLQAEGTVTVDLYDITPANTQGKPKMLERWEIDKDTLKRLGRKDTIGWGYTLFLPWSTYRPDIARVQLQARFVPEKGIPLFAPAAQVSVQGDEIIPAAASMRSVPPTQRGARTVDNFIQPLE
ncbi:MAG: hypothetical protein U0744_13475 [Gemmataceae bacterium]